MINIPIDRRREYLKKIYNALSTSPVARAYAPDKVKDIAITSEYECCENSKSESEYHSGIAQIILRIQSAAERLGPGREDMGRPQKPRPTAISNSQVFFGGTHGFPSAPSATPGARVQNNTQCCAKRLDASINNMYANYAPDFSANMGAASATALGWYGYSKPHAGGHMSGRGDFMSQGALSPHGYRAQDYAAPQLLRRPEAVRRGVAQPFRGWDMHDRDVNGLSRGARVVSPARGSASDSLENIETGERHKGAGRTHAVFGESGRSTQRNTLRQGLFSGTASMRDDAQAARHNFAGADTPQRSTKENVSETPYSCAQGSKEPQAHGSNCAPGTQYTDSVRYNYGPRCALAPAEPSAEGDRGARVASLPGPDGLGGETLEFEPSEKLTDVAVGESEKRAIQSKLCGFRGELLAIEADAARHASLECSFDLSNKLKATCRTIRTQMECVREHRYFLREALLDAVMEQARKYAALAREELGEAQKSCEAHDFTKVCEKVTRAFRKMKGADSSFVFCIGHQ